MKQPHGQNFLVEKSIARRIVDAAEITNEDKVIEIGPGKGILTGLIAPVAKEFKAVEVDKELWYGLSSSRLAELKNTSIIHQDFLNYPFSSETGPLKIVSNLPYNVSTAILEKILPEKCWTTAVVMVQKEVGDRLTAIPSTKQYGSFTIICGYHARFEKLFSVGPGCFFPKPKVDSVVIKAVNLFSEPLDLKLLHFIRMAFSQRRKTAVNSLSASLGLPKENVIEAFNRACVGPMLRPENLDFEQYKSLYNNLFV